MNQAAAKIRIKAQAHSCELDQALTGAHVRLPFESPASPFRRQRARLVRLAFTLLSIALLSTAPFCGQAAAQAAAHPAAAASPGLEVHGHVVDAAGLAVPFAQIDLRNASGATLFHSAAQADSAGNFSLHLDGSGTVLLRASATNMQSPPRILPLSPAPGDIELVLHSSPVEQSVTVTSTRASVALGTPANPVATLDAVRLDRYPALTLDDRLRQHTGFELFRRSSSWIANPTSEGVSLRGLGSTAASRTLVLSDGVPLNDAFGGWIHWDEFPPEAIDAVIIASGGGSDLYGSSALGGVIDVVPARPVALLGEADLAGASEDTTSWSARVDAHRGRWNALSAGQSFRTAGYTVTAPAQRSPFDVPSNVHFQNGRVELDRTTGKDGRLFLLGNLLNEARDNGTLIQTNGTRLWRYVAGDDWSAGARLGGRVRGFGSNEVYRQTFSASNAAQTRESLTRVQHVATQEFGGSADASFHLSHLAFVAGGDLRDLRATDLETPFSANRPSGLVDTSARQRFYGGFGELLGEARGWSGALSLRIDQAANLDTANQDTASLTSSSGGPSQAAHIPNRSELVLSPRLGFSHQLGHSIEAYASVFRAFRTPTLNELYRTGQVGQQITLANSSLQSERATGSEGGLSWQTPGEAVKLRGTYFWTEINRPVSAVRVAATASSITNRRENLGQIQSQGVDLQAQLQLTRALSTSAGYQYAHAVITAFSAQPGLVGLWIPEVPRHSATAQVRYQVRSGSFTLVARDSGRAFDDSSNVYQLHSFFVLGAYAEHGLWPHASAYLAVENLLDRQIDSARTPRLTLATPRIVQGGLRLNWGGR